MSHLFGTVQSLHRALDYHLERHNVISSNIANVDTPGFRPAELVRTPAEAPEEGMRLERTAEGHMTAAGSAPGSIELVEDTSTPPGNDGNAVSLEREMSRLAANDLRYDGATKIVSRQLAMLRYAASDGTR